MDYDRIITHGDFDGVVSGAICSFVLGVDTFIFTGPGAITRAEISIGTRDVVCDLPYPLECGLWFDHHPGNCILLPGRVHGHEPASRKFYLPISRLTAKKPPDRELESKESPYRE